MCQWFCAKHLPCHVIQTVLGWCQNPSLTEKLSEVQNHSLTKHSEMQDLCLTEIFLVSQNNFYFFCILKIKPKIAQSTHLKIKMVYCTSKCYKCYITYLYLVLGMLWYFYWKTRQHYHDFCRAILNTENSDLITKIVWRILEKQSQMHTFKCIH